MRFGFGGDVGVRANGPEAVIQNLPPVADAGPDMTITEGQSVTLDGRGSYDPDGTIVTYTWKIGLATIGTGAVITYTPKSSGTYTISLVVTDDDGETATDTMTLTVNPYIPGA